MTLKATLLLIILSPAIAHAVTRTDTTITMSDDVAIAISLFVPDGTAPEEGYPAILSVHGFAGSRQGNAGRARGYADSGYVAMTFSVRGQGGLAASPDASGGVTNWLADDRVIDDVRELLTWLGERPDVRADRIGMEGISQGGVITWASAINRLPIRCAMPIASVPHFVTTHAHNGAMNYFTMTIVRLAVNSGLVRPGPFLDSVIFAYNNDNYDRIVALMQTREIFDRVDEIEVPIFAQLAWQDDLFSTTKLFEAFRRITSPMKILVISGGHGTNSIPALQRDLGYRFFRRWLRDDVGETIMHPDSAALLIDPATDIIHALAVEELERYVPKAGEANPFWALYFRPGAALSEEPPTVPFSITGIYLQNITNDSKIFRSEPVDREQIITGADITFRASSNAPTWQVNVLLFDHDPATNTNRPITRGAWQARDGGAERSVQYRLSPQLYTLPAGHVLEAHIRFGLPLVKPDLEFGRAPFAPQASSLNRFGGTAEEPARLRVFLAEGTTGVEGRATVPDNLDIR